MRVEETWARLRRGNFLLPYDYAIFDWQPSSDEVIAFQKRYDSVALPQAEKHEVNDALHMHTNVIQGFRITRIQAPPQSGINKIFLVRGLFIYY